MNRQSQARPGGKALSSGKGRTKASHNRMPGQPTAALLRIAGRLQSIVTVGDVQAVQASMGNRAVQRHLGLSVGESSHTRSETLQRKSSKAEKVIIHVKQYDIHIAEASQKYGIPMETIRAIIATESRGNPTASSGAAFGLMQITKGTWNDIKRHDPDLHQYEFTESNWQDPRINILFGAAVFRSKMKAVGVTGEQIGAAELAVMAYNAGEGTIRKAIVNAKEGGSKHPAVDCLLPQYLKPAIRDSSDRIYRYYLTGKGKSRNPAALDDPTSDEAIETAIDLKYNEVSTYPGVVRKYLAAQGSQTTTSTSAATNDGKTKTDSVKEKHEPGLVESFVEYISEFFKSEEPTSSGASTRRDQDEGKSRTVERRSKNIPVLHRGDQNNAVRVLQQRLNRVDLTPLKLLVEDSDFGEGTELHVKEFQRRNGLKDDGVVGSGTWHALEPIVPSGVVDHRQEIRQIQQDRWTSMTEAPPWIRIAEAEIGMKEIKGAKHNPRVVEYLQTTGKWWSTDETPWCSGFVNWVMMQAGFAGTGSAKAVSWLDWGQQVIEPALGAIGVISYGGGKGHVGIVVGRQGSNVLLLGGNQGNQVKVSPFAVGKFSAFVFPSEYQVATSASMMEESKEDYGRPEGFESTR